MKKISVLIAGRHATSISLEDEFYAALSEIAKAEKVSINDIITKIDAERQTDNLSAAVRSYILQYYRTRYLKTTT
ncbi:MAG: ribbon-helix-helix domain-containing protein [Alphaproteobacteria bacterium]|nr:ribbon-helix-helix domain-containing protein [Alphaproteobacteria bacterium]